MKHIIDAGQNKRWEFIGTKAEKIEIQLEFDFYKNALHEEMDRFVRAFIQANKIFPDNTPYDDSNDLELTEEDIKIMSMSSMIEKRNRRLLLEGK